MDDNKIVEEKLKKVFAQFLNPSYKINSSDGMYIQKLLPHLTIDSTNSSTGELQKYHLNDTFCVEWIQQFLGSWKITTPHSCITSFALRFIGLVASHDARFTSLQNSGIIEQFYQILKIQNIENPSVVLSFVVMLTGFLKHESGCKWILKTGCWKDVVKLSFENKSIYITRESRSFLRNLVCSVQYFDTASCEEIFAEVIKPLFSANIAEKSMVQVVMDTNITSTTSIINVTLELLGDMLKECLNGSSTLILLLCEKHNVEEVLQVILNSSDDEAFMGKVSDVLILIFLNRFKNKLATGEESSSVRSELVQSVYSLLSFFVPKGSLTNILGISLQCQVYFIEVSKHLPSDETQASKHYEFGTQLLTIQMMPIFTNFVTTRPTNNEFLDMYCDKMFELTSEATQRLAYTFRDYLMEQKDRQESARKAIRNILRIVPVLCRNQAVLVFQALMYNLKDFIPCSTSQPEVVTSERVAQFPELLAAVLEGLTILIHSFGFTWRESVETICLCNFIQQILSNQHLSSTLAVKALKLMQYVIQNFMPPNLALLMNTLEGSSIEQLGPLIHKRLYDPHWEVKDSTLEVLQVIISISEIKFPAFQEHILENKLCSVVLSVSLADPEMYVRASALKCLCAMVKVTKLWTEYLANEDLHNKMINILRCETEGLVRKEAAAVLREIYVHQNFLKVALDAVYAEMGSVAISDLHWEVKVNALLFWEKVIERHMSNQGMIDGSFPTVTFSRENRKIVTLTSDEIRSRLLKVLEELSQLGCLEVLLTTIQDCDLQVVSRAVTILTNLSQLLRQHKVLPANCSSGTLPDVVTSNCSTKEQSLKAKVINLCPAVSHDIDTSKVTSDQVIETIIKETDMNLLSQVYQTQMNVQDEQLQRTVRTSVSSEQFLTALSSLDLNHIVTEKNRWLQYCSDDLGSLLDDILTAHTEDECNAMDCY